MMKHVGVNNICDDPLYVIIICPVMMDIAIEVIFSIYPGQVRHPASFGRCRTEERNFLEWYPIFTM